MDYLGENKDNSFATTLSIPKQYTESNDENISMRIHSIFPASLAIYASKKTSYLNPHIWWWLGSSTGLLNEDDDMDQSYNSNIQTDNDNVSPLLSQLPDLATFETIQGCSADMHSLPHLIMLSIYRNTTVQHIQYSLLKKLSRCLKNGVDQSTFTNIRGSPSVKEGKYKSPTNITRRSRTISDEMPSSFPSL